MHENKVRKEQQARELAELERKRLAPRSSLVKSSFIQPF